MAVDIRVGSPHFGQWTGTTLSAENKRQFYVPEGFAHGFVVTGGSALFAYKCTDLYNGEAESSVLWNDPEVGIEWPIKEPVLSEKDGESPATLREAGGASAAVLAAEPSGPKRRA